MLSIENLVINYGAVKAVKGISIQVFAGEIFGLLGPNGAGKTSTLSAVEGLLKPASGCIEIAGIDISRDSLKARACMGLQLQADSFHPDLTVEEIFTLYAKIYSVHLRYDDMQAVLKELRLETFADSKYGKLSGGQQQRVSLAIATLHKPPLVLLDEPTTGLDPQSRRQLWARLEILRAQKHSIVLTTHSMEEAEAVCDRIAIVDNGRIICTGTPQQIIDSHSHMPEVIAASRKGKITLEDVFIGLTGTEIRN